ncbi:MAG: MFS transporter, partial [Candidatus Bathyarchaeota archaeon]|nr:MFS transporter [Candidatus Bathyarchaeota archaeon]
VFGGIIDRFGSRKLMISSVAFMGLTYLGLATGSGLSVLYMLGALQGLFGAVADMSMMIHLMSVMPEGRSGMVMGLYSESENVGGVIASPSMGYIYGNMGPGASVTVLAIVLLVASLASAVLIKEKQETGST